MRESRNPTAQKLLAHDELAPSSDHATTRDGDLLVTESYSLDGKHYVVIPAGGRLFAFAL